MAFNVRRDSSTNQIPVVGYQNAVDAQDVVLWGARIVTETLNSDSLGNVTTTYPILDTTHDSILDLSGVAHERRIDGSDVTAKASGGATLYPGVVTDPKGRIVPIFQDSALTVASANTNGIVVTYRTPVLVPANADGSLIVQNPRSWTAVHMPAVNVQATASRAAVAGITHIARSFTASMAGQAAAGVTQVGVVLRDGASGVGTVLWGAVLAITGAGDKAQLSMTDLWIPGTAGNAMTLEFQAAGGANVFEAVTLTGLDSPPQ